MKWECFTTRMLCLRQTEVQPFVANNVRRPSLLCNQVQKLSFIIAKHRMYTINRLQGSTLEDMLHPNFRSVNFSRNGNMMAVAHGLRSAWEGFPVTAKTKYTDDDIGAYMRSLNAGRNPWDMSEVSRELVTMDSLITPARNEDRTINTAWRSVLYEYWNHVFFDTMNFLQATAPDVGHFHPPNEEVFPITNDVVKKLTPT